MQKKYLLNWERILLKQRLLLWEKQILALGDTVQMFLSEELFSDKVTETGSQQNSTHRCVLMGAEGDLSRYLAKTLL